MTDYLLLMRCIAFVGAVFLFQLSHYIHMCYMTKHPNCLFTSLFGTGWSGLRFLHPQAGEKWEVLYMEIPEREKKTITFFICGHSWRDVIAGVYGIPITERPKEGNFCVSIVDRADIILRFTDG